MFIISLVKEDIFSIVSISGVVFKDALRTDTVFLTQILPELVSNYKQ